VKTATTIKSVRLIIGAASAYASIQYDWRNGEDFHTGSVDFKLPGGRGAAADLRIIANEHREKAARQLRLADIADAAALAYERG
jgi:hypothetical protein